MLLESMKHYAISLLLIFFACNKKTIEQAPPVVHPPVIPQDPPVAKSIGFFLDDWTAKNFSAPAFQDVAMTTAVAPVTVNIDPASIITKVPKSIFGNNANPYMTQIVTEPVLIDHMKNLD